MNFNHLSSRMLFCLAVFSTTTFGNDLEANLRGAAERRALYAGEVVASRMTSHFPVPKLVQRHTRCLASLRVVKAGFTWGGEGSTGMVSCRLKDGWSAPSYFNVSGVSFGFQIGVQFLESVLTFMTAKGHDILKHMSFQVGSDLSFAVGPVGQGGDIGILPDAALLTFDKAYGLYIGSTINGFILTHSRSLNRLVYGNEKTPEMILNTSGTESPKTVRPFLENLERYYP